MTYALAIAELPAGTKWTASFGYPGCPGYVEYYRNDKGQRWNICNGSCEFTKDQWHINQIGDAKVQS
jgi:hypothetical protein